MGAGQDQDAGVLPARQNEIGTSFIKVVVARGVASRKSHA